MSNQKPDSKAPDTQTGGGSGGKDGFDVPGDPKMGYDVPGDPKMGYDVPGDPKLGYGAEAGKKK